LQEPLLPEGSSEEAAAAGSTCGNSSSSMTKHSKAVTPAVPFLASVSLPPLVSPFEKTTAAAAAAATPLGHHTSAVFAGHVVSFTKFPWIKFLSMLMLCSGFCGLAVLGALIPLCTWYFVTYMVLFLLLTVLVTFLFIKFILVDPLCKVAAAAAAAATAAARAYSSMEQGEAAAAAPPPAAAAEQGCQRQHSSSSSRRLRLGRYQLWERLVGWTNVLAGSQLAVNRPAAAADGEQQQQQQPQLCHNMSLFRREQLKQQLQLQQPFLGHNMSFKNVGEAAAAAAVAAAAAAEAQSLLGDPLQAGGLNPDAGITLVPPQHNSLAHIAAAGAVVAAAAGIVSGVCGLAGAALLIPALLDFRVHPQVSTATSVLLVCAGSCTASLAFAVQGRLNLSYALVFAVVSVAGVCAGIGIVGGAVRKTCRQSVVMLLLAGFTGLAAFFSAVYGVQGFAHDLAEGEGLGFRALCLYV
jgi:hypothetical protein